MTIKEIENKFGPQYSAEIAFTKKARSLQSIYRVEYLKEKDFGVGPNKNSTKLNKETNLQESSYYGNMIINGKKTGKNFFYPQTFEYALERVKGKNSSETIGEYRLFNNLLSSMPMAFNLFHPLIMMKEENPNALNNIIKALFPKLPIHNVDSILIEFVPIPISKYTNDKSAMDVAILFSDDKNNKYIIAIETKYTDSLGKNKASDNKLKYDTAKDSELFTDEGLCHISEGCTQIYRNFLLTEKYRMVKNLKDSFSIILAPEQHPSTKNEIESLLKYIKPEYHYKLEKYSLEDFIKTLKSKCPDSNSKWIQWFDDRYLDFNLAEQLLEKTKA